MVVNVEGVREAIVSILGAKELSKFTQAELEGLTENGFDSELRLKSATEADLEKAGLRPGSVRVLLAAGQPGRQQPAIPTPPAPAPPPVSGTASKPVLLRYGGKGLFVFTDASGNPLKERFYLDPDLQVTKALLHFLTLARNAFLESARQRPGIITGLVKTGKSFTLDMFLLALLHTYGMPATFEPGAMPPKEYAEGTPVWCTWHMNCVGFSRTNGLDGFLRELLDTMKRLASNLGFRQAAETVTGGSHKSQIYSLLDYLPKDRVHFMLVDEMQSLFLLERPMATPLAGRAPLDANAVADAKRFIKELITLSPPHVVWVFTGSAMGMIWASLAQAPVNGFDLITFSRSIPMSCTMSPEHMERARDLLSQRYPDMPHFEAYMEPQHPALMTYLVDDWANVYPKPPLVEWYDSLLESKVVPELIADLGAVLELMDAEHTPSARVQMGLFVNLFDPFVGVDVNQLHRFFRLLFKPYLRPLGDQGRVCVNSPLYNQMLQVIMDEKGTLLRNSIHVAPLNEFIKRGQTVRSFGELVWRARKESDPAQHSLVEEVLKSMAVAMEADGFQGQSGEAVATAFRSWDGFAKVLSSEHCSADAGRFKKADENAEQPMPLFKLLWWYFSLLRHTLTHGLSGWQSYMESSRPITDKYILLMEAALHQHAATCSPQPTTSSDEEPGRAPHMSQTTPNAMLHHAQRSMAAVGLIRPRQYNLGSSRPTSSRQQARGRVAPDGRSIVHMGNTMHQLPMPAPTRRTTRAAAVSSVRVRMLV